MTKTETILVLLGKYKYLTITQMLQCGVNSYHATQKLLKTLVGQLRIGVIKYAGSIDRANFKAENIYYLMPGTAEELKMSGYAAQYPKKRSKRIGTDYKHRIFAVNVQLSFERWIEQQGYSINLYKNYFTNSDDFETATALLLNNTYIVPDFIMSYTGSRIMYFVGELTNGHEVTLAIKKLKELHECMVKRLFLANYGWDKTPRVLAIMESDDLLRLTLKRIKSDPYFENVPPAFLFNTVNNISESFETWYDISGNITKLSEI